MIPLSCLVFSWTAQFISNQLAGLQLVLCVYRQSGSGGSRGDSGGSLHPPLPSPPQFLNILWNWNNLVSVRPNYFTFMGYLRKMRWNQQCEPPHIYTYKPPFQKSLIRPRVVKLISTHTVLERDIGNSYRVWMISKKTNHKTPRDNIAILWKFDIFPCGLTTKTNSSCIHVNNICI